MNIKTLTLLYTAGKYKDIINILRKQDILTDDEHNFFLLSAVKYGLKYDYVSGINKCLETDFFQNINKLKSYILTESISKGLSPKDSTFIGYIPLGEYIIDSTDTIDEGINKLSTLANSGSSYFLEQKNNLMDNNPEKLSIIYSCCLIFAKNTGDFDIGLEALNFFKNNMQFKTSQVDRLIVFFITSFIENGLIKLQGSRELFKLLLSLSDSSLDALFAGYFTQTEFTSETLFKEKINDLERFKKGGL